MSLRLFGSMKKLYHLQVSFAKTKINLAEMKFNLSQMKINLAEMKINLAKMKFNLTLMKLISCFLLVIFIFWHNLKKLSFLNSYNIHSFINDK